MSRMRQGYLLRGVAILIAAVFSGAWTFSVAGMGGLPAVSAAEEPTPDLPDGSSVPSEAIDAPASLSNTDDLTGGNGASVIAASSTNAIPSAALAAYQRAESVINKADESCNITWQLIAAIGRVESNHGRVNGNVLDSDGVASPGIYGPALNGTGGVKAIADTDAGQYDSDERWDRAVGPMQFIPSTWSVVGVDADGDGMRNPQDIDDAALAAAVYLCSGDDDLSTLAGQKSAIFRYNNSTEYVNLVLDIMEAYLEGDYTAVEGTTTAGGFIVPDPTYQPPPAYNPPRAGGDRYTPPTQNSGGSSGGSNGGSSSGGSTGGSTGGSGGETGGDGGGGDVISNDPGQAAKDTTKKVTDGVKKTTEKLAKGDVGGAVEEVDKEVVGGVTTALIDGLLGPLAKDEVRTKCKQSVADKPLLVRELKLTECLLSYGLRG
ncbi:lytic murein transglycosylase [Nocardioides panacisoli]|uniref:lytic transglycosylase domain-containing protein n=1 Tax=Nocardioides panacisoli TaxID=627624 RepID=UPI001C638514|nr:lytic murein transglycosylase [Nocardioides panacisoli]QYJ03778.1 lytic murein transglycosylase [Nocardioides panacisoli]